MTSFLFWNLNKKSLEGLVRELAEAHDVDVLILTECTVPTHVMLEALNRGSGPMFHLTDSEWEEVVVYTRFSGEFLQKQLDDSRLTIRRLTLPARDEILLAALHHPSKLHWSREYPFFYNPI